MNESNLGESSQSHFPSIAEVDWESLLARGNVYDVYIDPMVRRAAILELPAKPSRVHSAGPRFTVRVSNYSHRVSALTLDPPVGFTGHWGRSLTIRDSTSEYERKIVTPAGSWIGHVAWSPNGNWVSFVVKEAEVSYLWVASTEDGAAFRMSDRPINLMVVGQQSSSLRHPTAATAYLWLPDESGIVFAEKDNSARISIEEWSTITVPISGDSRNDGKSHPAMRYSADQESLARRLSIEKAYSRNLVVAPIDGPNPARTVRLPEGITHLLHRASASEVTVVTVEISSSGEEVREAMTVSMDGAEPRVKTSVVIPSSANWRLYSSASPDDAAIVRIHDGIRSCLVPLNTSNNVNRPRACFEGPTHDVAENASSLLVLHSDGVVSKVSKKDTSVEGSITLMTRHSDMMYLLQPPGFGCDSGWAPVAVAATLNERRDRLSSYSMTRIQFEDNDLTELLGVSDQNATILPTGHATCDGRPLVSKETAQAPKNYFVYDSSQEKIQLTDFDDVMPEFRDWRRIGLDYARSDHVPLSAEIVLPTSTKRRFNGRYPAIVWQYPIHFEKGDEWENFRSGGRTPSGSYRASAEVIEYSRPLTDDYIGSWLPNLLALDGYAVIAYPDFPLIGADGNPVFGSYAQQLCANAEALIEAALETDIIDEQRIAIGGHSRGGATAALLLAETDLFAAGISYAGPSSFNSHLNGFQYEDRSYWEYPDAYVENSTIFQANRINEPLLSMYGELDNLPTREQGHDLHSVLTELGGTSRLIVYPDERHDPAFRETQISILEEVSAWLEDYLTPESLEPTEGVPIAEGVELEQGAVH